jgi:hypothetical protein
MAFRSDIAASQARLSTLEEENKRLAEELAQERARRPKPPSRVAFSVVVLFASLLALTAGATTVLLVAHRTPAPATPPPQDEVPIQIAEPPAPPTPTKDLVALDLRLGTGATPKKGDTLKVHYTGTLPSGVVFDTSYSRNAPFTFRYGEGQVIKGWEQGLTGMRIGGKRRLTIPPHLAYGPRGSPPQIPPNATLIFEVELLGIDPTPH